MRHFCKNLRSFLLSVLVFSGLTFDAFGDSPFVGKVFTYEGKLPSTYATENRVSLEASFYESQYGNDVVSRVPRIFKDLPVASGVFKLKFEMDQLEFDGVFRGGEGAAWIQIRDLSRDVTFRRQRFSPDTPRAAGAPAEDTALPTFPPHQADSGFTSIARAACLAANTAGAKFIVEIADRSASCESACVHTESRSRCIRGWTMFSGNRHFEFGDECQRGNAAFESPFLGRVCCCVTTVRPMPAQLESKHH